MRVSEPVLTTFEQISAQEMRLSAGSGTISDYLRTLKVSGLIEGN